MDVDLGVKAKDDMFMYHNRNDRPIRIVTWLFQGGVLGEENQKSK